MSDKCRRSPRPYLKRVTSYLNHPFRLAFGGCGQWKEDEEGARTNPGPLLRVGTKTSIDLVRGVPVLRHVPSQVNIEAHRGP